MALPTQNGHTSSTRGWGIALAVAGLCLAAGTAASLWGPLQRARPAGAAGPALRRGVEGETARPPEPPRPRYTFTSAGPAQAAVTRIAAAAEASGTARAVGVAVYDLRRDEGWGVRANRIFKPASVIKLAVMVAAFQAREEGAITTARFERLRPYLRRMITVSDNPSTTYLVRAVGRERVNRAVAAVGLQHTHLSFQPRRGGVLVGSTATAAEVALLLAKLARREVVSPEASNEMLLLLGASQRRARIPAGLPDRPGVWVGNKTGTLNRLVHDSAVVLDPERGIAYTLAIFTEGTRSEAAGQRLCIALSRAVYAAMNRAPSPPVPTAGTMPR